MNDRDGTSTFLPLDSRIGGQHGCNHPTVGQFLTREQTRYICKKIEMGSNKYRHYRTRDRTRKTAI